MRTDWSTLIHILDICGTLAFAVSGAFRAVKHELDILGVLALATVTGIGGGILRDILLGSTPPDALVDYMYVLVCLAGGIIVFLAAPKIASRWDYVLTADAIGLSVFAAIGAAEAEQCGATPLTIVLMAMMTACGGGIIRDLLVMEIPVVLKSDFYATAALCGGACFVFLGWLGVNDGVRTGCTIVVTLLLRGLAMKYKLQLPRVKSLRASPSQLTQERRTGETKSQEGL
jgi:uncharacterized membrane protein YeiH